MKKYTALFLAACLLPALAAADNAALNARLAEVRRQAPPGFTVLVQPPFIVAGDEAPDLVRAHALHTVQWAVTKLRQDFFAKDPAETIAIWLFKDQASYEKYTRALFHDTPTTPFGYYSESHRALIMNIATGGGTLVHEIVHPFMRENFPRCPAWFNEGLGSLYEQSEEKDGHIHGRTNWRLAALQKAIQAGRIMPFQKLTALTDNEFYGDDDNPNYSQYYAQARYLCYYLQEHNLLRNYYREFSTHAAQDPTGYASLLKVLGVTDMGAFTKTWSAFVLALKFP
ncbi:MAG: hypothetical protein NTV49_06975 [Kiritimatiellaeota bacterium]|nr:hypothetical protein [Kiritimatiellota bacterium]